MVYKNNYKYLIVSLCVIMLSGCGIFNQWFVEGGQASLQKLTFDEDIYIGKEVLFDASKLLTGYAGDNAIFRWEFGDDIVGYKYGTAVVHSYMRPGRFKATLEVINGDRIIYTLTQEIIVVGDYPRIYPTPVTPEVLELKFENSLSDTSDNELSVISQNENLEYVDGVEGRAIALNNKNVLRISDSAGILSGTSELTISFWIKKNQVNDYGRILAKKDAGNSAEPLYAISLWNTATQLKWINDDCSYGVDFNNTRWHHVIVTLGNGQISMYFDGKKVDSTPYANIAFSANDFIIGDSDNFFGFYIDELKIYRSELSNEQMFDKFELLHADFHARTGQYLYFQIPEDLRNNSNIFLNVLLTGNNTNETLFNGNNLGKEVKLLFKTGELLNGKYILIARIFNSVNSGTIESITRKFTKEYDGIPQVGIDENNSIRIKRYEGDSEGELYFPVTSYMAHYYQLANWINYSNTIYALSGAETGNEPSVWYFYLNEAQKNNFMGIGPGSAWSGSSLRNSNLSDLVKYVNYNKENSSHLFWMFQDEPDLGVDATYTTAPNVKAWTLKSHMNDPHHPVTTNLQGVYINDNYDWGTGRGMEYQYMTNESQFGKKTLVVDIYGMDYYPIDWASPHGLNANFSYLARALDLIKERTYNLVPYMSFIETCNINLPDGEASHPTTWHPTPAMLKMLIWINVIHGVKGINWFHYFTTTPAENYAVMAKFKTTIDELKMVILGPDVTMNVEKTISGGSDRIDIMIRENAGEIYIFAVRISELNNFANSANATADNPSGYPDPVDNSDRTVTFNLNNTTLNGTINVYDEFTGGNPRTITLANGVFVDTFKPYEVHIYRIN